MDWALARIFGRGAVPPPSDADADSDDTKYLKPRCFVVMPFGIKLDLSAPAQAATAGVAVDPNVQIPSIDFDRIYHDIIEPAIKKAGDSIGQMIDCERSDKIRQSGFIHKDMIERLINSEVAIVDITTQNANVFYELGVRHSFCRSTTILIRRKGTNIPFNIAGMRTFDYSDDDTKTDQSLPSPKQTSIDELAHAIKQSFEHKENDSLIHNLLPHVSLQRSFDPILEQRWIERNVLDLKHKQVMGRTADNRNRPKRVGFITGDIMHVEEVDAWINPENTNMEMARIHDGSVSSLIRYYGAARDQCGRVTEDIIRNSLQKLVGNSGVEPGAVVVTGPGRLGRSNGVKAIFHMAIMHGEPGYGYHPARDYTGCFRRVLRNIDLYNQGHIRTDAHGRLSGLFRAPSDRLTSVLCPLFGSRTSGQSPLDVAYNLMNAAVVFFQQNPNTDLMDIYFLAYTDQDRMYCEAAMGRLLQSGSIEATEEDKKAGVVPPVTSSSGDAASRGAATPADPPPDQPQA